MLKTSIRIQHFIPFRRLLLGWSQERNLKICYITQAALSSKIILFNLIFPEFDIPIWFREKVGRVSRQLKITVDILCDYWPLEEKEERFLPCHLSNLANKQYNCSPAQWRSYPFSSQRKNPYTVFSFGREKTLWLDFFNFPLAYSFLRIYFPIFE